MKHVLRDMKKLDKDNLAMFSVSISQNEIEVCKSIAASFPYIMHKQGVYVSHILFVILLHIIGKYFIILLFVRKIYIYDTFD